MELKVILELKVLQDLKEIKVSKDNKGHPLRDLRVT